MENIRERYLELIKLSLADALHQHTFVAVQEGEGRVSIRPAGPEGYERRLNGLDWPATAETMIGVKRLDNIRFCIESILRDKVPGDFVETGVWRGGATIFMRACLEALEDPQQAALRHIYACDSFQGLPKSNPLLHPADAQEDLSNISFLAVSEEEVQENFRRYGLLDERVHFVKGWFRDTLPTLRNKPWSLLRLDGDLYESTINALENLYPSLSPGGYVIVDDYGCLDCCKQAVLDYRAREGITAAIHEVDWTGVFWRK